MRRHLGGLLGGKFWVVHTDVATADGVGAVGLKNEQTIEGSNPAKGIDSETVKTDTDEKKSFTVVFKAQ